MVAIIMATGDEKYHDQFPSLAISLSKKNKQSSTGGGGGNGNCKNNTKKKNKYRSIYLTDLTTATNYGGPPRDLLAARVLAYEGMSPNILSPPPPAVITANNKPENIVMTVLPDLEVEATDGPWRQLFSKPASSNMVASLPAHKHVSETPVANEEETVQVSNEFSDTTTEDVVDEVDEILVTSKQISETSVVIETSTEVPELISVESAVTSDAEEDDHLCKKLEEEAVQFVHGQKLEELKQQLGELEASAVIVREAIIKLEKGVIW